MINKPKVKNKITKPKVAPYSPPVTVTLPIAVPFKLPVGQTLVSVDIAEPVAPVVDFNLCIDFIKKSRAFTDDDIYCEIGAQEMIIDGLSYQVDTKSIVNYLADKVRKSRFRTFKLAMEGFNHIMDNYLKFNSVPKEHLIRYRDLIPITAGEHWYEEFNDLRKSIITIIIEDMEARKEDRNHAIQRAIGILAASAVTDAQGFMEYVESFRQTNKIIIDVCELIWPENGKSLKLLFGETDAKA